MFLESPAEERAAIAELGGGEKGQYQKTAEGLFLSFPFCCLHFFIIIAIKTIILLRLDVV